jgi:hypothetical protein
MPGHHGESYREQAASRAVSQPTCHSYLPHALPNSTYSFKSVDGGVGKFGVLALRVTSDIVQEQQIHQTIRLEKLPLAGKGMFVGLVQLFSAATGELLAIMPDGLIQQTRVGVTSALGMKVMARRDSQILGLIGSGGQAKAHYRYMTAVMPIKKVKVYSPNAEHRKAFVEDMAKETGVAPGRRQRGERARLRRDLQRDHSSRPVVKLTGWKRGCITIDRSSRPISAFGPMTSSRFTLNSAASSTTNRLELSTICPECDAKSPAIGPAILKFVI